MDERVAKADAERAKIAAVATFRKISRAADGVRSIDLHY